MYLIFTSECKRNETYLEIHYCFQIRALLTVRCSFFHTIRFYTIAAGRNDTLNKRIMNCLVGSFSQYGGGPASLASQTTLSEFREFDGLPRIGFVVRFHNSVLQFTENPGVSPVTFLGSANKFPFQKRVYLIVF
jgi:hypothetical protein